MVPISFLPLADFKTVTAPTPEGSAVLLDDIAARMSQNAVSLLVGAAVVAILLCLWLWRQWRSSTPGSTTAPAWILVDGSNVMHWQDNMPNLAPVLRVLERLKALGYEPGVVFDANAGWKLFGRYMDDEDLAQALVLPRDQVFVVPKGTPADPYLLATARDHGARIVTNDRYRDWAETHPEVLRPGALIRGGMRDGSLWLQGIDAVEGAALGPGGR